MAILTLHSRAWSCPTPWGEWWVEMRRSNTGHFATASFNCSLKVWRAHCKVYGIAARCAVYLSKDSPCKRIGQCKRSERCGYARASSRLFSKAVLQRILYTAVPRRSGQRLLSVWWSKEVWLRLLHIPGKGYFSFFRKRIIFRLQGFGGGTVLNFWRDQKR